MNSFKIGCQTYSWEWLGTDWQGTPEQILHAVAAAGYAGVEFSNNMIGRFYDHPELTVTYDGAQFAPGAGLQLYGFRAEHTVSGNMAGLAAGTTSVATVASLTAFPAPAWG